LAEFAAVNGREFTADDIVSTFTGYRVGQWFYQTGSLSCTVASFRELKSVTAVDRYTAVFKWSTPNPEFILETMVTNHNRPGHRTS